MFRPEALLMRLEPLRRCVAVFGAAWQAEREAPKVRQRTATELAFLPAALEIMETPASPLGRGVLWLVIALFSSAMLWASLGQVDIHATAYGRVITAGKTKPVSPIESATIAAIHVKDGDRVAMGQLLINLDAAAPRADVERLRRERFEYLATAARLRSFLGGQDDLTLPPGLDLPADVLAVHRAGLRQRNADYKAAEETLRQEKLENEAKLRESRADLVRLQKTVPMLAEQAKVKNEMAKLGWQSRTEYLRVEQEHIDRRQEMEGARHRIDELEATIASVGDRLRRTQAQYRAEALAQLAEAEQKADALEQDLAKADNRLRLYSLVAPVAGTVQQLSVHAEGAFVAAGQPVLMVVPEGEGIAVEAVLQNKDVGFVRPGQAVEIKIESFPFTRYGTLPGEVAVVSSDTVGRETDSRRDAGGLDGRETGGAGYSVRIHLLRDAIQADGLAVPLLPGMAVTAEIKTGRRSVISYLLDPILRYGSESLRDR